MAASQTEMPVPVTARLSKLFYERLGEQVANELVDWFNAVDDTYKAELREFNELNFARFDAKVEQRFAQSDAKLEQRFAQWEVKLEQRFAELRGATSDLKAELIRWMFLFWAGSVVANKLIP
jgi:CRP-like cAMP-binding protein